MPFQDRKAYEWKFVLTAEHLARFDSALHGRGIEVQRDIEDTARRFQTGTLEKVITGTFVRGADRVEFRLQSIQTTAEAAVSVAPDSSILTIGTLTYAQRYEEPMERRMADEIEQAFPEALASSPSVVQLPGGGIQLWKTVVVFFCVLFIWAVWLFVFWLVFGGASKLFS